MESTFLRSSGVLLAVSSLPGEFGIGDFSDNAVQVGQVIADMGFLWWQVLPLTTIGSGNSPYSGVSGNAYNYLYVDPYGLQKMGLLDERDIAACRYYGEPYLTDYSFAYKHKKALLTTAYSRLTEERRARLDAYLDANRDWLFDYAVFMVLKERYADAPWQEWGEYARYDSQRVAAFFEDNKQAVYYYVFEQYILELQWQSVRARVRDYGIRIIGDIPIYVQLDSVDVWSHAECFLLDRDTLMPEIVAGVPPDYFAEDGQLWNNPVYDVKYLKKSKYEWWMGRLRRAFTMYDGLRIDHFRGLYEFWACPTGSTTAKNGKWYPGLGKHFIDAVREQFGSHLIIAEDLGQIDDEVRDFVEYSGFPGMRVMQFAFEDDDSLHLPHNFVRNSVAYTATHDNNTTLGWLYDVRADVRDYALRYCGFTGYAWGAGGADCQSTAAFIRTLIASVAQLVIVPMQDLCGFGGDTRMNTPGEPQGCWRYRLTYDALYSVKREVLQELNSVYGRRH